MQKRPGKTVGYYMSPRALGYLAWARKWLKTSKGKTIEQVLYHFIEQHMQHGTVYTTWNQLARALRNIPGNWDGFEEREDNPQVCLTALSIKQQPVPGWLEVLVKNGQEYEPCILNRKSIADWLPAELQPVAPKRVGVAVPVKVLAFIEPSEE